MFNGRSFVFALWCLVWCLPVHAQRNHFSIAPAPAWLAPYQPDLQKRPNSKDIAEGFYQLVFEEQIQVEKKSTYRHVIRDIVSEAGIQNGSQVSVEYDPSYEQLIFHTVVIRRDGQVINKLATSNFKFLQQEEDINAFIYSGTYTAHLILDDVRKGDQIEYAYTVVGRNPIFEDKYFHTFYLTSYQPIVNFYKCVIADSSRHFTFKSFNGATPLQRSLHGREAWYQYNGAVPLINAVDDVPSWYTNYPYVQVSEYHNWKEVVQWAQRINTVKSLGPLLTARIALLKEAAGGDRAAYMEKAIRFVQDDIRYMGIEMGQNSHLPHTPDRVLTQRFGDCKDKSLLLCTLLRANGIAANMAYANTDEGPVLDTYLPSPDNFNHAIVHASLDGKGYWIDPTIAYQRGTLQTLATPDYGQSLIVSDTSTGLTAMNTRPDGAIYIHEELTVPDNNEEDATLKVTSDYTHYFADDIRDEYASNSVKDEEENFLSFYKKIYGDVVLKDSLITTDSLRSNHFSSLEHYIIHKPWRTDSADLDKRVFNFRAKAFMDGLTMIDDEQRKAPVELRFPYRMHYRVTFKMDQDFPEDEQEFDIKNAYYHLHFKPVMDSGKVSLYYDYETYTDHVPAEYVRQYIKDINRIWDVCYYTTTQRLSRGGDTLADSRPGYFLLNFTATAVLLFCLGLFGWFAFQYFHRYHPPLQEGYTYAWSLGGWLVLLGIGLFFSLFLQLDGLFRLPVFNYLDVVKYTGNKNWQNGSITEMLMLGQLVTHVFFFVYTILLAFLFYYRRELFPVTTIVYFIAFTCFSVLEVWLASGSKALGDEDNMVTLGMCMAGACIWIPYLRFSRRSRETFLLPHTSRVMERRGF